MLGLPAIFARPLGRSVRALLTLYGARNVQLVTPNCEPSVEQAGGERACNLTSKIQR